MPPSRRYLARHAWCVISRHRLQRVCYEARLHTRAGRLPAICWIRPTKVGERAWILCRAGICADDFDAHIGRDAAACYAREARVARNKKWSQLLTLDIVRRDPLRPASIIASPLERLTPRTATSASSSCPPRGLIPRRGRPAANPAPRSPAHTRGRLPGLEGGTSP